MATLARQWWIRWSAMWRSRPFTIHSTRSVADATRLLGGAVNAYGAIVLDSMAGCTANAGNPFLSGPGATRNSWRPQLSARLVAVPGGCDLVGRFGLTPFVWLLSAVWQAGLVAFAGTGLGRAGEMAMAGHWSQVRVSLGAAGLAVAMLAYGTGLMVWGTRRGREDERQVRRDLRRLLGPER